MHVLTLQDVSKYYGKNKVLDCINLDVRKGEIFVLLGSNGCGKSTLLRIMATLQRPSSGRSLLFGSKGTPEILKHVGIVFDHTAHWDKLTGYENAWLFARSYGLSESSAASRLDELFKWICLDKRCHETVAVYSYGMRRKLSLIEALVHEPGLLLMDEPSMGLDYASRLALYTCLKELSKKGVTTVLATNDVNEAELLADRVVLLRSGRVIAVDSPSRLMASLEALIRINLKLATPISVEALRKNKSIVQAEASGDTLMLQVISEQHSLAFVVKEVTALGGMIQSIEVKEPNLGDVFLKLAGSGEDAA